MTKLQDGLPDQTEIAIREEQGDDVRMEVKCLKDLTADGKGHYGIGASAVPRSGQLPTYLRISDINDDGTLNTSDLKSVDDPKADRYRLEPNDIVFARTGNSTGRNYFYDGKDGDFVYAGYLIKFSLDPDKVNPRYIKYYCQSRRYKNWVSSFNTGSTRGNINARMYEAMEIPVPSRERQDFIVEMLAPIDEYISLSMEMNENLISQAQAIYEHLFLTNADAEWERGRLADFVQVKYGKDHRSLADGVFPVYGSGGIMRYVERPLYEKESVLIPRKGTLNNIVYVNEPFWSVDTMFYTEMRMPDAAKYVYHFLKTKDLASMNTGSAVPSMTADILNSLEIVIPPPHILGKFNDLVEAMYLLIRENNKKSCKFKEVKDTLLPQLISGEAGS